MALYGKVGDKVIIRENMNNIANFQGNQHMNQNAHPGPNMMNLNQNSNQKSDFSKYIRLHYHNPGSIDIASNATVTRDDLLKQLRAVNTPDLSKIQGILESCETMKQDYKYYLDLNVNLDDILKQKVEEQRPKESVNPYQQQYNQQQHQQHQQYNPQQQNQQFQQQQQASGYTQNDVQRFTQKFKCADEMAIGYLEAFQSYSEAEQQFIMNTGWKA